MHRILLPVLIALAAGSAPAQQAAQQADQPPAMSRAKLDVRFYEACKLDGGTAAGGDAICMCIVARLHAAGFMDIEMETILEAAEAGDFEAVFPEAMAQKMETAARQCGLE